ncbi:Sodium/calcium exchanger protein-domain-containing protein [Fimicolochytrium jonesii]|uniref:Sodium/calcium exchanger protein-domain-containing protein n=1 Tax=Fimicolochytrium jonesii TaxID=1396493 RepID=UPI0022FEF3B8|nr:Sodium/calcium exchanger protein-domain-containing protein [Fimicolochytrium jonesii]KAI8817846.1 Sodium/calcium exchanger protein-domain-containing protein [Fimicolochytrium jonesii]
MSSLTALLTRPPSVPLTHRKAMQNAKVLTSLILLAVLITSLSLAWFGPKGSNGGRFLSRRAYHLESQTECKHIGSIPDNQCAFAEANCTPSDGVFNYFIMYYCRLGEHRVLGIIILFSAMIYAFLMLGMAAGDFLCPNLANISQWLQMSESVAGVTLAALGNGSPDLVSTFSAMTSGKEGVAIGELLGAAMFVTFVVVGSIAIVHPFKLPRRPFLRDLIAFIGALILVLVICSDKKITLLEGCYLIAYYFIYVTVVVAGAYLYRRHKARRTDSATVAVDDEDVDDDVASVYSSISHHSHRPFFETDPLLGDSTPVESPFPRDEPFDTDFFLPHFKPPKLPLSFHNKSLPVRFSRSLTSSPPTSFGGREHRADTRPILLRRSTDISPNRGRAIAASLESSSPFTRYNHHQRIPPHVASMPEARPKRPISSTPTPESPTYTDRLTDSPAVSETGSEEGDFVWTPPTSKWRALLETLFPVIPQWGSLSILDRVQSVILSPVFFAFSATVPAVHAEEMELYLRRQKKEEAGRGADSLDEIVVEEAGDAKDGEREEGDGVPAFRELNRELTIAQVGLAPMFVVVASGSATSSISHTTIPIWTLCIPLGLIAALALHFGTRHTNVLAYGRMLAIVGFCVSVVWVYVIASEAVVILSTMATVLKISETIMGMTLFAIGNSVGDLITNLSIARMGYPAMAVGACFGSPMLNLVLGIGVTSTYITAKEGVAYELTQSLVPIYACGGALMLGLCISLLYISTNDFAASRTFGMGCIAMYAVFMVGILVVSSLDAL